MSLTTVFTEGGMYNKVLSRVCQRGCIKICYISVRKNENYMKKYVIYVLYILIVMYLDP